MNILNTIEINLSPNIIEIAGRVLSWHGFFTFVAVALAVFLVARWSKKEGLNVDAVYSVAVWTIIGGIVGARLVHVIDFWDEVYQHKPIEVFYLWNGGIAIFGAILGGFIGGASYILVRNSNWLLKLWGRYFRFAGEPDRAPLPGIGHLADITAPALLIGMAIGRIGDIINGEHFAKATSLAWGVIYTHPGSQALQRPATHPAVAYELLFDLALVAVLWPLRNRLRPGGMLFTLYVAMYAMGRFFLSFLREEFNEYFLGLDQAQIIALGVMLITIPLLAYKAKLVQTTRQRTVRRRAAGKGGTPSA